MKRSEWMKKVFESGMDSKYKAIFRYFLFLFGVGIVSLIASPAWFDSYRITGYRFWGYIATICIYCITAFAGFLAFNYAGNRLHLLTQSVFIFIAVVAFFKSIESLYYVNALLFFASYSYLVYSLFYLLRILVEKLKKQVKFSPYVIVVILAALQFLIYIFFKGKILALEISVLLSSFFVSLASIHFYIKQKIKIKLVILLQIAFFSSLIYSIFSIEKFQKFFYIGQEIVDVYLFLGVLITIISLMGLLIEYFFLQLGKRKILVEGKGAKDEAEIMPFSIYPDHQNFVDVHEDAEKLEKFIKNDKGGVIGIAGVRGAGKSTLLKKIIEKFKDKYFTLNITSPVSSGEGRADFFVMVFREVCLKIIEIIEKDFFRFRSSLEEKALKKSTRMRFTFFVFILLLVGFLVWFVAQPKMNFFRTGESVLEISNRIYRPGHLIQEGERKCIESLYYDLNTLLKNRDTSFDSVVIVPGSDLSCFQVIHFSGEHKTFKPLIESFKNKYSFLLKRLKKNRLIDKLNFAKDLQLEDMNDNVMSLLYYSIVIDPLIQQLKNSILLEDRKQEYQNHNHELIHFIENGEIVLKKLYLAPEQRFQGEALANSVAEMFNLDSSLKDSSKLLGWVILEAFITHAPSNDHKHLLLDKPKIKKMAEILEGYLQILPMTPKKENVLGIPYQFSLEFSIGILFAFLIVSVLIFRWIDIVMSTFFNRRVFKMWYLSKAYLNMLAFAESNEEGGGVAISKFNYSFTKRRMERPLNLAVLTNMYVEYIQKVSDSFNKKIIICIDELDKLDKLEDVEQVLREIKGGLYVTNSYYLISISQDAVRNFQNRLSSDRDIFESTFDEFITLKRLNCEQAWSILEKYLESRSEELNGNYKLLASLLVLFGGGIPRELLRNARRVWFRFNGFGSVEQKSMCQFLFKRKVDEFYDTISEIPIPGEASLELLQTLKRIKRELCKSNLENKELNDIEKDVSRCIQFVDPNQTYLSVATNSIEEERKYFETIRFYIERLVELLILCRVLNYAFALKEDELISADFVEEILDLYKALEVNPALAVCLLNKKKKKKKTT